MKGARRFAIFFALWLVLSGADPWGLPFGVLSAALAARASLALMPGRMVLRDPVAALRLAARIVGQAVLAGADIARRAFDPRLPLQLGLITHVSALAPGPARDVFTALASLAPGALPAGTDASGALVLYALDTRLPLAADLAATEALYARV